MSKRTTLFAVPLAGLGFVLLLGLIIPMAGTSVACSAAEAEVYQALLPLYEASTRCVSSGRV